VCDPHRGLPVELSMTKLLFSGNWLNTKSKTGFHRPGASGLKTGCFGV